MEIKLSDRYLLQAPPNVQVVVPGAGLKPHSRPVWPKIPSAPSAFTLLGEPRAPGNKPNSLLERCKSLGGRLPEAGGNLQLPRHTRPDPCRSKHGRPKCDPTIGEAQCYYSRCSKLSDHLTANEQMTNV